MTSGNPAKAAVEEAVRQVRAGITNGQSATIALTPDTKVTINTADADEAEFMTRLIVAHRNPKDDVDQYLNLTCLYAYLFMGDAKYRKRLLRQFKRLVKDMEESPLEPI